MMTLETVLVQVGGVSRRDVEHWVEWTWVAAERRPDGLAFAEIDVARLRLIAQLRDELEVNEAAMPVVLGLLDQVYALRRVLREVHAARGG